MLSSDRKSEARWLRLRAEECRSLVASTSKPELRHSYAQLTRNYEALASECELSFSNLALVNEPQSPPGAFSRTSLQGPSDDSPRI